MTIELKVPMLPESVADAVVAKWYKKPGDHVERDENIVDLETDKVMLEVPAPRAGVLSRVEKAEGSVVKSGELLAVITEGEAAASAEAAVKSTGAETPAKNDKNTTSAPAAERKTDQDLSPSVRRMVAENNVDVSQLQGSGKGGRVVKEDVQEFLAKGDKASPAKSTAAQSAATSAPAMSGGTRTEQRVPMSRLRAKVAERLVEVQHTAAILTTFNEVNMKPVMDLRQQYKDAFEKAHGARLGFMSFFVKAVIAALQRFPVVNASIEFVRCFILIDLSSGPSPAFRREKVPEGRMRVVIIF